MSNDWKKQLAELSKNEEFQKKQSKIVEKFKDDEATIKAEITKLMAEYGVTEPEGGFMAPIKELSDDELGAVAGGKGYFIGGTCFCFMGGGGEAGPALCVCVAAGGGSDAYEDSSKNGSNGGGCGCAAFGWGDITGEY